MEYGHPPIALVWTCPQNVSNIETLFIHAYRNFNFKLHGDKIGLLEKFPNMFSMAGILCLLHAKNLNLTEHHIFSSERKEVNTCNKHLFLLG